jgi:hypothetical protein
MHDEHFINDLISLFIKKQDKIQLRFPVLFIQHMALSCGYSIWILFSNHWPLYRYLLVWYVVYGFWLLSRRNIISIVWRNWIRLKLIYSSYLPIDRYVFSRRPWKYHSARQGRLDWTCFTSLVKFYLVSRKKFHINIS